LYTEIGQGVSGPRLAGRYTPSNALRNLLADTPLEYEFINERTVAIQPKGAKPADTAAATSVVAGKRSDERPLRLAQTPPESPANPHGSGSPGRSESSAGRDSTAQEAGSARSDLAVQEITVTARRREETLQTTPVAVTALTGDALEVRGASSV